MSATLHAKAIINGNLLMQELRGALVVLGAVRAPAGPGRLKVLHCSGRGSVVLNWSCLLPCQGTEGNAGGRRRIELAALLMAKRGLLLKLRTGFLPSHNGNKKPKQQTGRCVGAARVPR